MNRLSTDDHNRVIAQKVYYQELCMFHENTIDALRGEINQLALVRNELLEALKEIIPAQDNADECAAARESELLTTDRCNPKTAEYFRAAKIRLMKAREAVRAAIAKAEGRAL